MYYDYRYIYGVRVGRLRAHAGVIRHEHIYLGYGARAFNRMERRGSAAGVNIPDAGLIANR